MFTRASLKSLATPTVFNRGEDYFLDGNVSKIAREGNTFKAKVRGTYTYKTKLILRPAGNELRCNCPYDFEGICKHAVALGLAVLEEFGPTLQAAAEPAEAGLDVLEEAQEGAAPAVQQAFLADLLRKNADLRQQFLVWVGADDEAAPAAPLTAAPLVAVTPESVSTEVYEALSDLEFDDDRLRGYTDYYGDYLDDEGDGLLELADEAIKEVLDPHARTVAAAVRGGGLHEALRYWVGVYEGSRDAKDPQADNYDLFSYEGYPARVLDCWWTLLDEQGVWGQLETVAFAPAETAAALALLFDRYPAGVPEHFEPVLLGLAHQPTAATQLRPLLEAAPPDDALEPVLLRVAGTLADDALWLRVAEERAPRNAPMAIQLLDYYRQHHDRPKLLRLLHQLWEKYGYSLMDYVLSHVAPTEDLALYLQALEQRCRVQQSLADYRELREHWTAEQRHQFVDEQLTLGERYHADGLFAANLLAAEHRDAELLPYLLRRVWVGQRSTAAILTLAAQTHPDECMDALMERTEKMLQNSNFGRGRDVYQQLVSWLLALDAFPALHPQVALFAAHLYTEYSRLNALREELRTARLVRTQKVGNQYKLLPPTPEQDEARALARDKQAAAKPKQ